MRSADSMPCHCGKGSAQYCRVTRLSGLGQRSVTTTPSELSANRRREAWGKLHDRRRTNPNEIDLRPYRLRHVVYENAAAIGDAPACRALRVNVVDVVQH